MSARRTRTDRIAEDAVANLCRAAGASVQKVSEDDNGWDLLVEFPPQLESAYPDLDPPLTRCLIQVKSVQSRRKSTRVKISNALKFAKDPIPCFVALLTYPAGPKAFEAAYIRHVWATDMAQAIEAARRTSSAGHDLNTKYLPIAFSTGERADGELVGAVLEAITRVGNGYAEKKGQIADNLGYENGWGEGQFVLSAGHDQSDLQDLLLGLREDIPIESFSVAEARFGVKGPVLAKGPGRLSIDLKPSARCVITLQHRESTEEISWTGALFASGMQWLPRSEQKVRIAAGPLDLVITGTGAAEAEWSAPLAAQRTLDELERDALFRSWMDGSPIDLYVWTERGALSPFKVTFDEEKEDKWSTVLSAIRALSRVVPLARRPEDLTVSMGQLLAELSRHQHLSSLIGAGETSVRIEGESTWEPTLDRATHIVFPWVSRLNDYFLVSVIEREISSLLRDGGRVELKTRNSRLLRGTAVKASDATDLLIASEVEWAKERSRRSDKRILSFHPDGDGSGTLKFSTDDED